MRLVHRLPSAAATMLFTLTILALFACAPASVRADEITRLDAWADLDNALHVRWITAAAAKCQVQYGPTDALGSVAEEDPNSLRGTTNNRDSGIGFANNHRADIPGIKAWPLHLRVTGLTAAGAKLTGQPVIVQAARHPVGNVARAAVPLTIHPGDWKLDRLPITVGVPFPQGALGGAQNVRILIADREVPSQPKVITRWQADNTVKWLRIDFLASRETPTVTLEYGNEVKPQSYGPTVDSVFPGMRQWPPTRLVAADGTEYNGAVEDRGWEESGPVKAVLRARGHYVAKNGARLCAFTMRYHLWNWTTGSGGARVDFTFENDNTASEFTSLRSLMFGAMPGSNEAIRKAISVGVGEQKVTLDLGQRVIQREDSEWVKEPGAEKGRRLEGVIAPAVGGEGAAVIRHFWQQWPISIGLPNGDLELGLCPELPKGFYANRKDEDKLYYQIRDGLHTFRQGFSKTWEMWWMAGDSPEKCASVNGELPVASLPPEWIEQSGALRKLAVAARGQFAGYDEAMAKGIDNYLQSRDGAREYGMMNFGDWYGERTWNWGNLEYDLGHGFLTQFARTGKPEFFWRAEECLRHERDVDTRHYAKDPRQAGQQWTHCMGHTAGYYPKDYKDMEVYASPGWSDNRGHVWAQGMFEHYVMGGDMRSWETGKLIADWAAGPQTTNFIFGNAREPGWMTKLVMSAYFATEDPYYLNAARIMLDKVHEQSVATGDHGFYYHKLQSGHCDCPEPKHSGEAGFMLGVLMTGMKMYYEATGEERVADDIVKAARFIVQTMWVPDQMAFRYTSCPKTTAGPSSTWIMMEGLAFAAARSGDPQLAEVCRSALAAAWRSIPTTGKGAGYVICSSAQALEEASRLPGPSFADYRATIERALRSPARRALPTNIPNPDFEVNTAGWGQRGGVNMERTTEIKHSGQASLKISGKLVRANEYVVTNYDTGGAPEELVSLKPGQTYRLTAWLRVDKITPGTAAPNLRLQFRDDTGSKGAQYTNSYDLKQLGTWQKLTAIAKLPDYNTRNYIALNTNSRDDIVMEMYLDDLSLVPVEQAAADQYAYYRLDPSAAVLTGGAKVGAAPKLANEARLVGPGEAEWRVSIAAPGAYTLWGKVEGGTPVASALINGKALFGPTPMKEDAWLNFGRPILPAGEVTIKLPRLPAGAKIGRLVLTNDPSSSL